MCLVCVCVCWVCVLGVCVVCGEAWHTLSLLFSLLSLLFPFLFISYLSFSFSLAPALTLALALVLSLSLLSSFYLLYSLFSSLPFTPTNTVQSTDQQTRRPTLRRLNVMWRTVRS